MIWIIRTVSLSGLIHSDSIISYFQKKMTVIIKICFDTDKMILFLFIVETGLQPIPDQILSNIWRTLAVSTLISGK